MVCFILEAVQWINNSLVLFNTILNKLFCNHLFSLVKDLSLKFLEKFCHINNCRCSRTPFHASNANQAQRLANYIRQRQKANSWKNYVSDVHANVGWLPCYFQIVFLICFDNIERVVQNIFRECWHFLCSCLVIMLINLVITV